MAKRNVLLLLLCSAPLLASAQKVQEDVVDEAFLDTIFAEDSLVEVVVTGTRTPKFLKETPIQTRVISARDIARQDATNVQDLLQQELPGVEFSYAMNQQTHLNFSGFGGQGVLFLIDGERLAGETMDDVDFSRLTMDNVERIEIVKGAASALYGSNAVGGLSGEGLRPPDESYIPKAPPAPQACQPNIFPVAPHPCAWHRSGRRGAQDASPIPFRNRQWPIPRKVLFFLRNRLEG